MQARSGGWRAEVRVRQILQKLNPGWNAQEARSSSSLRKEPWSPPCLQDTVDCPGVEEAADAGPEARGVQVPGGPNPGPHLSLEDLLVQREGVRLGCWVSAAPPPTLLLPQACTPTCCVPDLEVHGFALHLQVNSESLEHRGGVALGKKGARRRL